MHQNKKIKPKNEQILEKNKDAAEIFLFIKSTKTLSGKSAKEKLSAFLKPITNPKIKPKIRQTKRNK